MIRQMVKTIYRSLIDIDFAVLPIVFFTILIINIIKDIQDMDEQLQFQLPQNLLSNQISPFMSIKKAHNNSIQSAAAHPSNKIFATGSHDKMIKLWDVGQAKETATLSDHKEGVWSLDYSRDGKLLVSASPDKSVLIWDSKKASPGQKLLGHNDKVYTAKINEANKCIASIGEGAQLLIWDMAKTSSPIKRVDLKSLVGYDISWSSNGQVLFVTTMGAKTIALNGKTFEIINQDSISKKQDSKMLGCTTNWETFPGRLFCASDLGHIVWYEFKNGKLNKEIEFGAHIGGCRNVNLHPHIKYMVSSGRDGSVRLWNCNSEGHPQIQANLVFHEENVTSPIFLGDQYVVTGSWDENIAIWKFQDLIKPFQ